MATHKLFLGGKPQPYTYGREMFPSVDVGPYEHIGTDARKFTASYSNTRKIDFTCSSTCLTCGEAYTEADQLRNYFENNTIAVGDVIELIGIAKFSTIDGIWWNVEGALVGFEFDLQIKGLAGSSIPATVNVGTVDTGTAASGYFEFSPKLYADHNDMVQLLVTAVPAVVPGACNSCINSPFAGLKLWLSVDGKEMCKGDLMT